MQVIPSCWKAETKSQRVNNVPEPEVIPEPYVIQELEVIPEPEVRKRKLWLGEKVSILAGSAKLVKVRIEGDWRGEGFVESMLPEEQNPGSKLLLPETIYNVSRKEPVIFVENHTKEEVEISPYQR